MGLIRGNWSVCKINEDDGYHDYAAAALKKCSHGENLFVDIGRRNIACIWEHGG